MNKTETRKPDERESTSEELSSTKAKATHKEPGNSQKERKTVTKRFYSKLIELRSMTERSGGTAAVLEEIRNDRH